MTLNPSTSDSRPQQGLLSEPRINLITTELDDRGRYREEEIGEPDQETPESRFIQLIDKLKTILKL